MSRLFLSLSNIFAREKASRAKIYVLLYFLKRELKNRFILLKSISFFATVTI